MKFGLTASQPGAGITHRTGALINLSRGRHAARDGVHLSLGRWAGRDHWNRRTGLSGPHFGGLGRDRGWDRQ
ncbi:MAG: hypothetical protein ACM35G_05805, partial [Planctomycetaceae bacterium]